MKCHNHAAVALSFLALVFSAAAQTSPANSGASSVSTQVPRLIRFSGVAKDETGKPASGVLGITFALYRDEQGGAPLWIETQNVQADAAGHYTALLGSATADGVPLGLFSSTEAHWISTQISGRGESARMLLLSVPYALKAADAETLGGMPASAFVQATPTTLATASTTHGSAKPSAAATPAASISGTGTTDYIPLWTSATAQGSSILFQTGGNVGVNTKTPGATLDTAGTAIAVRGTSSGTTGKGLVGTVTSTTGVNYGVQGQTDSTTALAAGVNGFAAATTGEVFGVSGTTNSTTTNAMGVSGYEGAAKGQVYGVDGYTASTGPFAAAVGGFEGAATGQVYGVTGGASSTTNGSAGINGNESATTGVVYGVNGGTSSTTSGAAAVNGYESAAKGQVFGIQGGTSSATNFAAGVSGTANATTGQVYGVVGVSHSTTAGAAAVNGYEPVTTGAVYGVYGSTPSATNGASGVFGVEAATKGQVSGVAGSTSSATNGSAGVSGSEGAPTGAVYGVSGSTNSTTQSAAGVSGYEGSATGFVSGVLGSTPSTSGTGVAGFATSTTGGGNGVEGGTNGPTGNGVFGSANATSGVNFGVQGVSSSTSGVGVQGSSPNVAVAGFNQVCVGTGCKPVVGTAGEFVTATGGTILRGLSGSSFSTLSQVLLVDAAGNLTIKGKLTKGSGSFKIDDPLDPAHKYLSHSFVESPDMMNVYNGNITTDKHGLATVVLPNYFEALNRDFRYQLTVIGQFAQAIVKQEIENNRFTIKTNKPSVKVSWQVTGIRHDAYADAYRIPVEEEKPTQEQGHFLHPELFGASEQLAIGAGLHAPSTADSLAGAALPEADAPVK